MLATSRFRLLCRALPVYTSTIKEGHVRWQNTDAIPAASAASIPAAAATASSSTAAEEVVTDESGTKKEHFVWRLVKGALYLASTAAVGGSAYVSYAYSADDVEKFVAQLRSSAKFNAAEELDFAERLRRRIYTASVSATTKVADYYLDVRRSIEDQVRGFSAPSSNKLLPDLQPQEQHVFTLVLDLNETLVYSDWKRDRGWRTFKRPGVEAFLEQLAQYYELVIYSDQLNFYVDPILDRLDQKGCIRYRLSRDATQYIDGKHMRDLSKLNRDPARVIYLSGHALESTLNPENALPIKAWKLAADDTSLLDLLPFLEYVARNRPADIRTVLASYQGQDVASEFKIRHQEYQRRMQERKQQSRFWRGSAISRSS
ncbi:unnamed protein product [Calypogeia fissa]